MKVLLILTVLLSFVACDEEPKVEGMEGLAGDRLEIVYRTGNPFVTTYTIIRDKKNDREYLMVIRGGSYVAITEMSK